MARTVTVAPTLVFDAKNNRHVIAYRIGIPNFALFGTTMESHKAACRCMRDFSSMSMLPSSSISASPRRLSVIMLVSSAAASTRRPEWNDALE